MNLTMVQESSLTITIENIPARNNWLVNILAAMTFFISAGSMAAVSVLFNETARDLHLNVVQIGSIWGMVSFGSIFMLPVSGFLCDRLGAKRTLVIFGLLTAITGALRGLSNGFFSLMATTFVWGLLNTAIVPPSNIIISRYATPEKQGLAQGFLAAGGGTGLTVGSLISASWLSPLLGGWRNVFFLFGGATLAISLIWQFAVKAPPKPAANESIPLGRGFGRLLRLKDLWLIGLTMLAYSSCIGGVMGYLPYHLESIGWSTVAAGGVFAAFAAAGALGTIPLTTLSDRIGSRKILLYTALLTALIGIGLMAITRSWIFWPLAIAIGLFFPMSSALFTTVCIELKEVGAAYAGMAVSLTMSMASIGKTFFPILGNSLATINGSISWPFILWAFLAAIGFGAVFFVKETGWRSGEKNRND
jgi:MFS family permease